MGEYWIQESIKNVSFDQVYDLGKKLGHGATAVVHVCSHKGTKENWAVKIIEKEVDRKAVARECGVLLSIIHPNIVRLKEIFETDARIWMVLEYVKGGELFDRIVAKGYYSEKDASKCVREMLEALKYLHEYNVCHRDLKPENLLLEDQTDNAAMKMADFGLAEVHHHGVRMNTVCGTPGYCAPEVLKPKPREGYGLEVDLWSVGVITYILLCGYEPFYAESDVAIYKKIIKGDFTFDSPWWDEISENAKDLVRKLLVKNPKNRLTAEQALKHDWVTGKANKTNHMEETLRKLKELQARKKLKAVTHALHLTSGWEQIITQPEPDSQKQDIDIGQALMGLSQTEVES